VSRIRGFSGENGGGVKGVRAAGEHLQSGGFAQGRILAERGVSAGGKTLSSIVVHRFCSVFGDEMGGLSYFCPDEGRFRRRMNNFSVKTAQKIHL
jgi:hypothetical protein